MRETKNKEKAIIIEDAISDIRYYLEKVLKHDMDTQTYLITVKDIIEIVANNFERFGLKGE